MELVSKPSFDLILMDIHMPVMDGYEAVRAINAGGNRRLCQEAGMEDYVEKPIGVSALRKLLRSFARRR